MKTHNQAKASWPKVRRLRAAHERSKQSGVKLDLGRYAKRMGISRRSAYRIVVGDTWPETQPKKKKGAQRK